MKTKHEQIFSALKEIVESKEIKDVLQTSEVDKSSYYLLNPQLKILVFLNRDEEIIVSVGSNGSNGFTEFKKTIPLK
jgi:hypothetical protein